MNKTKIVAALRALRTTYGPDAVTCSEMEADLASVHGLPPTVAKTAAAAYKNAEQVAKFDGGSRLSANELARIGLNTAIGAAKRGIFGA